MNSYVPEQNTNLAMMFGTCHSLHINLLGKPDSNWNNFSWIKAQTNSSMPLTSKHARGSGNISEMLLRGHDHLLNIKAQTSPLYSDHNIYPIWSDTECNQQKPIQTEETLGSHLFAVAFQIQPQSKQCWSAHTHTQSEGSKVWQTQGREAAPSCGPHNAKPESLPGLQVSHTQIKERQY